MKKLLKIFLFILPLFFLTGCNTYYHFEAIDPVAYVYAFTNLDVIILMISMVLASFIYTSIVAPLALSLIGLAAVFDVFKFFFQMMRLKEEESMFWNVNLLLQFLFKLIGISVLLLGAPVGIKVLTAMPKSTAPDNFYFKSLSDIYNAYELQQPVVLDWEGKPSDYFHPDSIFYINADIEYKDYFTSIPFAQNLDMSGNFKVDLPLALALPVSFADSLLYGNPPDNSGIIPALFPKSFPVLIFKPSLIFDAIFKNAPVMQSSDNINLNKTLLEIAKKKLKLIHDVNYGLKDILFQYNNVQTTIYNYFIHDPSGEQLAKKIATTNNDNDRKMYWNKVEVIINDGIKYQEDLLKALKDNNDFLNASESDYIDFIKQYNPNEDKSYYTDNSFNSVDIPKDMLPVWLDNLTKKTLYGNIFYKIFDTSKNIGNFSTNITYLKTVGTITLPRIVLKTTPIDTTSTDLNNYVDETQLKVSNTNGKKVFLVKDFDINNEEQSIIFDVYAIQKNIVSDLLNNTDANLYEELIMEEITLLDNIANYDVLYQISNDYDEAGFAKGTWIPFGEQSMAPSDWLDVMPQSETAKRTYYFNNIRNYLYKLFYPNGWEKVTITEAKKKFGKYEYNSVFKIQALINYFKNKTNTIKEIYVNKLTEDLKNIDQSYTSDNVALNVIINNVISDNMNDIYQRYNQLQQTFQQDLYNYRNSLQKYLQMYASRYFSSNIEVKESETQETKTSLSGAIGQLLPHGSLADFGDGFFATIAKFIVNIFILLLSLFFKLVFIILQLFGSYVFGFLYSLHTFGIIMIFLFFPIEFTIRAIFKNEFEQPIFESFRNYLFYRMIDFVFLFILALMGVLGPILMFMFSQMNMLIGTLFSILMIILVFYLVGVFMDKIMNLLGAQDTLGLGGIWKKTAGFMAQQGVGTAVKASMYGTVAASLMGRRMGGSILGNSELGKNIQNKFSSGMEKIRDSKVVSIGKGLVGEVGKDLTKINSIVNDKNPLNAIAKIAKDEGHTSLKQIFSEGIKEAENKKLNKKITSLGKQHAGVAEKIEGDKGTTLYKMNDGTVHMKDAKGNIKEVKNFKVNGDKISYTTPDGKKIETDTKLAATAKALKVNDIKGLGNTEKIKLKNGKTFVNTDKGGVLLGTDGKVKKIFDKGTFEIDKEKGIVRTIKNTNKTKNLDNGAGKIKQSVVPGTWTDKPKSGMFSETQNLIKGFGSAVFSGATANTSYRNPTVQDSSSSMTTKENTVKENNDVSKIDTTDLANKIKLAMREVFNNNPEFKNINYTEAMKNDKFKEAIELTLKNQFDLDIKGQFDTIIKKIENNTETKIKDFFENTKKNIKETNK